MSVLFVNSFSGIADRCFYDTQTLSCLKERTLSGSLPHLLGCTLPSPVSDEPVVSRPGPQVEGQGSRQGRVDTRSRRGHPSLSC